MSETFERNAKGVREMLSMKFDTLDFEGVWHDAFGTPERRGVWFVWGTSIMPKRRSVSCMVRQAPSSILL